MGIDKDAEEIRENRKKKRERNRDAAEVVSRKMNREILTENSLINETYLRV